jgi:hypothetical protein
VVKRLSISLKPHGFFLDGTYQLKRELAFLNQFVEIQPGVSWLRGKLSPKIGWQFKVDGREDLQSYDLIANVGFLFGASEAWLDEESAPEATTASVKSLLFAYGLPFLDKYRDLQAIVSAYEAAANDNSPVNSPFDTRQFFGADVGWANYNLGWAYKCLGQLAKAKQHLEGVVNQCSCARKEWVQQRKLRALEVLAELESKQS